MISSVIIFLQAVSTTAAWACSLFFFRFWRESRDHLFAFFSAAFWLLGLSWLLLGLFSPTEETRPYIYAIRLVAFLFIIVAVIEKNRSAGSR